MTDRAKTARPLIADDAFAILDSVGFSRDEAIRFADAITLGDLAPFAWTPARLAAVMAWADLTTADIARASRRAAPSRFPNLPLLTAAEIAGFLAGRARPTRVQERLAQAMVDGMILQGRPPAFIRPGPTTGMVWLGLQFPPSCNTGPDDH